MPIIDDYFAWVQSPDEIDGVASQTRVYARML